MQRCFANLAWSCCNLAWRLKNVIVMVTFFLYFSFAGAEPGFDIEGGEDDDGYI
jgi:hypothetical protein